MTFSELPVAGAWLISPDFKKDDRGFFARAWAQDALAERGLRSDFVQCNDSYSVAAGTLRGLHWQSAPHGEVKLLRCIKGRVFDVMVDVRDGSPTYLQCFGVEVSAENRVMVYVPEGCAHGYLTLEADSEVLYSVTAPYEPRSEKGMRWDDPAVRIDWPISPAVLSPKDRSWPDLQVKGTRA